ncbi:MAG: NAD(P)/FAD-dependent oxidoreductase, partial [Chloroflexi bacterium]|nr:NAD(P)/FAD-dependent oxidoreductase [Chloroflexota bacterium]
GIYYGAAMTEAASCEGDDVYIIGGANSAGQAAMFFSKYARSVTLLVRGKSVTDTMSAYLIDELAERPNVSIRTHTEVVAVDGKDCLEQITIENNQTRERETLPTSSMFIFIGAQPRTDWLADIVERDKYGFILAGPDMMRDGKRPKGWNVDRDPFLLETSVPGIFVAGDVRSGSVKRVASGVGEGSIAISFIHRHLADL